MLQAFIERFAISQPAIFVTLTAKPGQRAAVMALWQDRVKARVAENPLETSYVYAFDIRDDTVITITEVFDSMDAFHHPPMPTGSRTV